MLSFCLVALLGALSFLNGAYASEKSLEGRTSTGLTTDVTWDSHSLFLYGQRVFLLSAEVHPWRQPNPELWADVFQKIRANGFNTVSIYINWAVHYPTPGTNGGQGDFQTGTYRDIQRFITEAKNAGLWVIARPGPYINAETTGGGFPGWAGSIGGALRTNNANYTQAWTPYMTAISKIIAQNQITNGGPIILVQSENEFSSSSTNAPYMQAIENLYKAQGIVVPITFNAGGRGAYSPDHGGTGAVNIYCEDSYPQHASSWVQVPSNFYTDHLQLSPSNPTCLAEFGGGYLLGWGGTRGGTGYEKFSGDLADASYENIFYKENYSQTTTIINIYMVFGGTNWGQTAEPTVYSSYDYGAGINENRVAGPKMNEMRLQGLFLRVARDLLGSSFIGNGTTYTSSNLIYTAELRNSVTKAAFYFVRHQDSTSTASTTTKLTVSTSSGSMSIPKTGSLTFGGREMKILPVDFVFGASKTNMLYSTAEVMTWSTIGTVDHIVLYAPKGQTGETVFKFASSASITVTKDSGITSSVSGGLVTLGYTLNGAQYATIAAGSATIQVAVLDKATALTWHAPLIPGSGTFGNFFSIGSNETVLVAGPYLVRQASISGNTLNLSGDFNGSTTVEFFAPPAVTQMVWNGVAASITATTHRSYTARIAGASAVTLPSLGPWKVSGSLPETDPAFNDASFVIPTQTSTNFTNLPPIAGPTVLYAQQYGFYGGHLIYRGHFTATGSEKSFNITVQGGNAFGYSAWFNGQFLGSYAGAHATSLSTNVWNIPSGTLKNGADNVLTVLTDHMGHVETSTNNGKEPRGIRGYQIIGVSTSFRQWRLQGNLGGAANAPDTFRGYLNEGGLYAERIGAHLPGFPDSSWTSTSSLSVKGAGVNFFRTTFSLNLPSNAADVPIRLEFTPSAATSNYRVQIYLNGWQLGKYVNNIGPQTIYVLPAGILKRSSANTLALALWSLDGGGASISGIKLTSDGAFTSSYSFADYTSAPDYSAQSSKRTAATFYTPM